MREIMRTIQFKRDVKRAEKRGKDMTKLRHLIVLLAGETPLPVRFRDHPLSGECTPNSASVRAQLPQQLFPASSQNHRRRAMSLDLAAFDHHHIRRGLEDFRYIM
jgi:mRNA-degrading endonuclease YafQ of YafQ-DinJ toxin-antitoxin module